MYPAVRLLALSLTFVLATWAADLPESYRATVGEDGVQHIQILGGSYFFKPRHIIVRANIPVELTVSREAGIVPHNLVIKAPAAGIDVNKDLGVTPKTITFTPTLPGHYPFYCNKKLLFFPSHREKDMEGVLEVVE